MSRPHEHPWWWVALGAGLILGGAAVALTWRGPEYQAPSETAGEATTTRAYYSALTLEAPAAIVVDLETGAVLYEKNAGESLPLASITKVMTALCAVELLPTTAPIAFFDPGTGTTDIWRLPALLDYMLVRSSNDAALAVARAAEAKSGRIFVEVMNERARALGLTHTHFENPTGLDLDSRIGSAYGSAADVATLFAYIVRHHPTLLEATRHPRITRWSDDGVRHPVVNTNLALGALPGVIGSKTGFTDVADGNLAIVFDRGLRQPVAAVVLGSSQSGRFRDMTALVRATLLTVR